MVARSPGARKMKSAWDRGVGGMHPNRRKAQMIKHATEFWLPKNLVISGLLVVVSGLAGASGPPTGAPSPQRPAFARRSVLPLVFEPNIGQTDSSVRFVARG